MRVRFAGKAIIRDVGSNDPKSPTILATTSRSGGTLNVKNLGIEQRNLCVHSVVHIINDDDETLKHKNNQHLNEHAR